MGKIVIAVFVLLFIVFAIIASSSENFLVISRLGGTPATGGRTMDAFGHGVPPGVRNVAPRGRNADSTPWFPPAQRLDMRGGGFNYLAMISYLMANPQGGDPYLRQLIEFYVNSYSGRWPYEGMDINAMASPALLHAVHQRETSLGMYLRPQINEGAVVPSGPLAGTTVRIDNLNQAMVEAFHPNWSQFLHTARGTRPPGVPRDFGVWLDHAPGGDGWPDGPFQYERANREGRARYRYIGSGSPYWDPFSMRDQANGMHDIRRRIQDAYRGVISDPQILDSMFGVWHNRGARAYRGFAVGRPYLANGDNDARAAGARYPIVNSSAWEQHQAYLLTSFFNEFLIPFNTSGLVYREVFTAPQQQRALVSAILLSQGWHICSFPRNETHWAITTLTNSMSTWFSWGDENPVRVLFPNQNFQNGTEFMDWVRAERVSNMGDVLASMRPGMTRADADRLYGTVNGYSSAGSSFGAAPGRYPSSTHMMFRITNDIAPAGLYTGAREGEQVLRAMSTEVVGAAYILSTGAIARPALLQTARAAGMPEVVMGQAFDLTNPTQFYQSVGGFSPQGNEEQLVVEFLARLGYTSDQLLPTQITQLATILRHSGGPYSQTSGRAAYDFGTFMDRETWDGVGFWRIHPIGNRQVGNPPHSNLIRDTTPWDPRYENIRATDCMTITRLGWSLGAVDTEHRQTWMHSGSTGTGIGQAFQERHTYFRGQRVDATLIQIDRQGNPMSAASGTEAQSPRNWASIARPGDIIIRVGHAETIFGINQTTGQVTFTAEETRRRWNNQPNAHTFAPGQAVFIGQNGSAGHGGIHTLSWATTGRESDNQNYRLFRPAFNFRPGER